MDERIANNIGLVRYIARFFLNTGYEYEDLVQEGMIGLIKAAKTFDEGRGFLFSTYAGKCIQKEILAYLKRERKHKRLVSLNQEISGQEDLRLEQIVGFDQEEYEEVWKRDLLERSIVPLDERQREILWLYYGEGMKQRDIAEKFHLSQPQICRLIRKSLEIMKKTAKGEL